MLLAALAMIPTVWLPDQKALSYLGFCGIAATLTVSAAVAFTFLTGGRPIRAFRVDGFRVQDLLTVSAAVAFTILTGGHPIRAFRV